MARLAPAYYLVDGTVPRSKLADTLAAVNRLCEAQGLQVGYVFHAGDGNLHPFILIPDPHDQALLARVLAVGHAFMQLCADQDGSITGEHGVGSEKRQFMPLMYNADELAVMADIKQVFDPTNLLNPGKILPATANAILWIARISESADQRIAAIRTRMAARPHRARTQDAADFIRRVRGCAPADPRARRRHQVGRACRRCPPPLHRQLARHQGLLAG